MKNIPGGICAPKGFKATGVFCGIRNKNKKDLALIVSETRAACACCYTKNLVKCAPIYVTQKNVEDGYASAIICNSGNANACAPGGVQIAEDMCALVETHTGIPAADVVVASTGVIGPRLPIEKVMSGMRELVSKLGDDSDGAAAAIMTTDTIKKELAYEFLLGDALCHIGGIAKGSGMIHPNMATMLSFITSDVAISPEMLQKALSADVDKSFNMISVDGDTSTNDMVTILANGMANNTEIVSEGADFDTFCEALFAVTGYLARMMAKDGEGATKLIECEVKGAKTEKDAVIIAKTVICSSLVKTAMFAADANWGRVLCAIGYSGADCDVNKVKLSFISEGGTLPVCENGVGIGFSEEKAKVVLSPDEIKIAIELGDGEASACAFGCDLTYEYVKINGAYRT